MSSAMALPLANASAIGNLIAAEVLAVREAAELSGNPETLLLLDLLQSHPKPSELSLAIALLLSARTSAAAGHSRKEWVQQLLNRHGGHSDRMETLWRTLVDLHTGGDLPWTG